MKYIFCKSSSGLPGWVVEYICTYKQTTSDFLYNLLIAQYDYVADTAESKATNRSVFEPLIDIKTRCCKAIKVLRLSGREALIFLNFVLTTVKSFFTLLYSITTRRYVD